MTDKNTDKIGLGLGLCCSLIFFFIGGYLFVNHETNFWDAEGVVKNADNCILQKCTKYGCTYDGTVKIEYEYEGETYSPNVDPDQACGRDCCQDLVRDKTTIYVTLDKDTKEVLLFEVVDIERENFIIAIFGAIIIVFGCCTCGGVLYIYFNKSNYKN